MQIPKPLLFYFLILLVLSQKQVLADKKGYIVYLGGHSHGPVITSADLEKATNSHVNLLSSFLGSQEKAKDAMFYSYQRHINGFAAMLEEEEAANIAKHPGVVSVFPNEMQKLHTTHTWEFLGLERNGVIPNNSLWKRANFGEDVILAHIDTGVWPESESFSDQGYGPIPQRWKGGCHDTNITCNKKLIGARYFYYGATGGSGGDNHTARDDEGHGSHTMSTLGGNFVKADFLGSQLGISKGGSPRARVATYKACWPGCYDADVLAAFDHAIEDGVDVISVSLGSRARSYFLDSTAIGALHAVQKNVVVTCSAGNDNYNNPASVNNVAPWITTVAASTVDRVFRSTAVLPNGLKFQGSSLSKPLPEQDKHYPLVYGADAKNDHSSDFAATLCKLGSLDENKVKGKIVVCIKGLYMEGSMEAANKGAVGVILCSAGRNEGPDDLISLYYDQDYVTTVHINHNDSISLFKYINSTTNPEAYITPTANVLGVRPSPAMAIFSSVGPNPITPDILKPDIAAPGVNIVASYSPLAAISNEEGDKRSSNFYVMSGTSMACPHLAGVSGLIRGLHPDWSPGAVRSAIMTTAITKDNTNQKINIPKFFNNTSPLNYGAGHVEPNRAGDPGLVYDLSPKDHLNFLCAIGYNETVIKLIAGGDSFVCPEDASVHNFNYPSIAVTNLNSAGKVTVTRTLKNVGGAPAIYSARIHRPAGVSVTVEPETLSFTKMGEEIIFKMSLEAKRFLPSYVFGELVWSDGHHQVKSPIVIGGATF